MVSINIYKRAGQIKMSESPAAVYKSVGDVCSHWGFLLFVHVNTDPISRLRKGAPFAESQAWIPACITVQCSVMRTHMHTTHTNKADTCKHHLWLLRGLKHLKANCAQVYQFVHPIIGLASCSASVLKDRRLNFSFNTSNYCITAIIKWFLNCKLSLTSMPLYVSLLR